jgi:hypothetical protein
MLVLLQVLLEATERFQRGFGRATQGSNQPCSRGFAV